MEAGGIFLIVVFGGLLVAVVISRVLEKNKKKAEKE